jgi:hypothetical protein
MQKVILTFEFMGCNFSIPFTGDSSMIINRAKTAVLSQGGIFQGDDTYGDFSVSVMGNSISGSYKVVQQELNLTIDKKPFFVPCATIESFLKKQIS